MFYHISLTTAQLGQNLLKQAVFDIDLSTMNGSQTPVKCFMLVIRTIVFLCGAPCFKGDTLIRTDGPQTVLGRIIKTSPVNGEPEIPCEENLCEAGAAVGLKHEVTDAALRKFWAGEDRYNNRGRQERRCGVEEEKRAAVFRETRWIQNSVVVGAP